MLNIVGIGPGSEEEITYAVSKIIKESQVLIGAERMLTPFIKYGAEIIDISTGINNIIEYINYNFSKKNITVVAAGDIGFYSIATTLKEKLDKAVDIKFFCGISSIQFFCSKINMTWNDMAIVSLHGREEDLFTTILNNRKTFVLTGAENSVNYILQTLNENGMGELEVYIGEDLSYESEKITNGRIAELSKKSYSPLSVIVIINNFSRNDITFGIPDSHFIRGNIPMTKEEIRAIAISKLRLSKNHIVYDVGSGTGSISIEACFYAKKVYSIEYNPEAIKLIGLNKVKFNASNLCIVEGKAPYILEQLPPPDRVFIGGSGGNIKSILEVVIKKNPNVRITINAIMLETVNQTINTLEILGYVDIDIVQISVSKAKKIGSGNMLTSQNPIFIITAQNNNI